MNEAVDELFNIAMYGDRGNPEGLRASLRSALVAALEGGEPVAWMKRKSISSDWDVYDFSANPGNGFDTPLFASPQAQPAQPDEEWLKEAALTINRLILMSGAKASEPAGTPTEDRITDADIDSLEAQLMAHLRTRISHE